MLAGILLISLVAVGLCWMFGFGRPERLVKFLAWLTFGPLLLGLFVNEWTSYYYEQSWFVRIALLAAVPFLILFLIRFLFSDSRFVKAATDYVWELLIFGMTFPVRLLWRSGLQISEREGNRIRLQRYRPVIGGRPPFRNDRDLDLPRRKS